MPQIVKLIEERGKSYGKTHVLAGMVIGVLREPFTKAVMEYPEMIHNWVLMLSKLIRMLHDPYKEDNYDDLIGYAELTRRFMLGKGKDNAVNVLPESPPER